ncbi:hypothetical protein EIL40_20305 [Escherichia coli]|uniref:Uncharacterized protein n=1 Tax=Salmonella enterica subsp. enterica serovar Saintpaul TaxID=90105 RepID=A0A753L928_SALET|nr:hypothetical protein [Salmonella enterica subsp. enterica]EAS7891231.1 hypothetical protein [Salmonella enterica]ECK9575677.1 hypothetical protein [Salmonella enterica subsp. enterica serovar Typhimurium]ECN9552549.1 hypothetical protein [Salmonella enterica subsp. enterica serovar Enteritidis]EFN6991273.1 hypothetical protein [Escherichia coli]HAF8076830.1 hypothetical protein [Salmonella enterica subsp. enterica serovar Saintpaul]
MLPVLPAFLIYRMSGSVNRIQIPGVPPVLTGSRQAQASCNNKRGTKSQPPKFPECANFALGNLYVRPPLTGQQRNNCLARKITARNVSIAGANKFSLTAP